MTPPETAGTDPDEAKVNKAAVRAQAKAEDVAPEEVTYTEEQLREGARNLLGVSTHAVAGALSAGSKKSYTIDEAKTLLDAFLANEEGVA